MKLFCSQITQVPFCRNIYEQHHTSCSSQWPNKVMCILVRHTWCVLLTMMLTWINIRYIRHIYIYGIKLNIDITRAQDKLLYLSNLLNDLRAGFVRWLENVDYLQYDISTAAGIHLLQIPQMDPHGRHKITTVSYIVISGPQRHLPL